MNILNKFCRSCKKKCLCFITKEVLFLSPSAVGEEASVFRVISVQDGPLHISSSYNLLDRPIAGLEKTNLGVLAGARVRLAVGTVLA